MGEFKVNDNGVWKSATPYVNDNGVWKQSQEMHVNDNGVWKKVYPSNIVASDTLVYSFQTFNWYTDYTAYKFTITRSGTARFKAHLSNDSESCTLVRSLTYPYSVYMGIKWDPQPLVVDLSVTAGEVFYLSVQHDDSSGYAYSTFSIHFDTTDGHTVGIIDGDICGADFTGTPYEWH